MKENKGFTLVELLAVIAILAILVIMALPAVLRMYRQSRISSFQNEVRTVYRTAQSQFLSDSMLLESGQTIAYTNAGTSVTGVDVVKQLDMTGNTDFKYYVLINVDGKVLNVRASNGTYSFSKQAVDTDHDLKIEDIDVETNNDSTLDSNITTTVCPTAEAIYNSTSNLEPTYLYTYSGYYIGETLTLDDENVFDNFDDAIFNGGEKTIAYIINENNEIIESFVAFRVVGNVYYLKGGDNGDAYNQNKNLLDIVFPGKCQVENLGDTNENYSCQNVTPEITVDIHGNVDTVSATCNTPNCRSYCSVIGDYSACQKVRVSPRPQL